MSSSIYWKLFDIIESMLSKPVKDWPRHHIHALRFGWQGSDYRSMIKEAENIRTTSNVIDMTNQVYITAYDGKGTYKHPVKTALSKAFKMPKHQRHQLNTAIDGKLIIHENIFISDIVNKNIESKYATIMWMLYNGYSIVDICDNFSVDRGYVRKLKNELADVLQLKNSKTKD